MTTVGTGVHVALDGATLGLPDLRRIAEDHVPVALGTRVLERAAVSRQQVEQTVRQHLPVYGVATGYSEMVRLLTEATDETELRTGLVRGHSAAVGPLLGEPEARAVTTARLNALAKGPSAVRPVVLERLALHLNEGLTPAVPETGLLGADGDRAALAHMVGTLLGEGHLLRDGVRTPVGPVLRSLGIEPLRLDVKECLALLNGTSAMTGVAALVAEHALAQARHAEIAAALVVEVLQGSPSPFQAAGHEARPHAGQIASAANMRALTGGSRLISDHADRRRRVAARMTGGNGDGAVFGADVVLQQAYSWPCVPQVIGAVRDTLGHATRTLEIELNSADDSALFPPDRDVPTGQPVAFVMDFLTIALARLGASSARRSSRLLHRRVDDGLPESLIKGGPGSAGTRYRATALVAENRTIGPASTGGPPGDDDEDRASAGLVAACNCRRVLGNNFLILALELLAAAAAVDVSGRLDRLSPAARVTYSTVRSLVPTLADDRYLADDVQSVADELARGTLLDALDDAGINLQ
ncbi:MULTISPECIES: tyrosine 2,3-aminomutase [unclassified Micromonospora]|uniref:tyrosine 2,3-aminomutase n=1 Tax=unclassified Micromonospora TaxID=2617518 RepID=UPI0033CA2E47